MKILQITTAAPGWDAVYQLADGNIERYPIPVWAIIERTEEDEPYQTVEALINVQNELELNPVFWSLRRGEEFVGYDYEKPG